MPISHFIRILIALLLFTNLPIVNAATPATSTQRLPLELPKLAYELRDEQSNSTKPEATEDLWQRMRMNFSLPTSNHKNIQPQLNWYKKHPNYLKRVSKRAKPYLYAVLNEVEARGLPSELALLPIVESAYDPFAYSHGRAAGLWQMIPGTAKRFGLEHNWWLDGRRDVLASTNAALDYLEYLHRYFDEDWLLALAAYNSGEGTVGRAQRKNRKQGKATDFWSLKLPKETRAYLPKMLALKTIILNADEFKISLEPIKNQPFLQRVQIGSQIDLDLAAELADISVEQIYRYNPAFNRWATPPKGPFELLIPSEKNEQFKQNIKNYPEEKRINWQRHTIKSGESLGKIAHRYRTTTQLLKKVNNLKSHRIRAGKILIIPLARRDLKDYSLSAEQRLQQQQNRQRQGRKKITHKVAKNETFSDIALKYHVGIRQLAKWNNMAPGDSLRQGRILTIWIKKSQRSGRFSNPARFQHPLQKTAKRRISYTVRSGDSLASISQRFKISLSDLQRWNKNKLRGKYLKPGQRLKIYVNTTDRKS